MKHAYIHTYIHKKIITYSIRLSKNFVLLLVFVFFRLEFLILSTCRCKSAFAASPSPRRAASWRRFPEWTFRIWEPVRAVPLAFVRIELAFLHKHPIDKHKTKFHHSTEITIVNNLVGSVYNSTLKILLGKLQWLVNFTDFFSLFE